MARTARTPADAAAIESAERLLGAGDPGRAAAALLPLEPRYRDNPDFLILLARAEIELGKVAGARAHLAAALRLSPGDAEAHFRMAVALRREGRITEALASIERALELRPGDPLLSSIRADLLDMAGRHAEALAALEPHLVPQPPHLAIAVALARLSPKFGRQAEAADTLEAALLREPIAPGNRAVALFALANLLDGMGEFDRAFEAAERAHALRKSTFDPAAHSAMIDSAIAGWTAQSLAGVHRASTGARDPRPVLIIGMPRSGTSLVEQVLASHPAFFGAGERAELTRIAHELSGRPAMASPMLTSPAPLRRQTVERCSRRYTDMLRSAAGNSSAGAVSDKNPTNFLHLGLAWSILPEVRVIHCTRDPRDAGLSCYFHDFAGVLSFVHDLGHIAAYWRDYQRLMAHWRSVLDLPMLDIAYEDLIADQEGQTRRMLEFLGLPWDDACLSFQKTERITMTDSNRQVRRGLYSSSVGRWKHYQHRLRPLLEGVAPGVPTTAEGRDVP
jgi:tetratricopeptide (TPR) repeat protein